MTTIDVLTWTAIALPWAILIVSWWLDRRRRGPTGRRAGAGVISQDLEDLWARHKVQLDVGDIPPGHMVEADEDLITERIREQVAANPGQPVVVDLSDLPRLPAHKDAAS